MLAGTHLPTNQPTHNPINLNGIHEALERSGVAHRQRESFPSEPAPELEAKRPPPQPKTTAMGGSGGGGKDKGGDLRRSGNDDDHQQRCPRRRAPVELA